MSPRCIRVARSRPSVVSGISKEYANPLSSSDSLRVPLVDLASTLSGRWLNRAKTSGLRSRTSSNAPGSMTSSNPPRSTDRLLYSAAYPSTVLVPPSSDRRNSALLAGRTRRSGFGTLLRRCFFAGCFFSGIGWFLFCFLWFFCRSFARCFDSLLCGMLDRAKVV